MSTFCFMFWYCSKVCLKDKFGNKCYVKLSNVISNRQDFIILKEFMADLIWYYWNDFTKYLQLHSKILLPFCQTYFSLTQFKRKDALFSIVHYHWNMLHMHNSSNFNKKLSQKSFPCFHNFRMKLSVCETFCYKSHKLTNSFWKIWQTCVESDFSSLFILPRYV